jgi:uncharacterized protein YbjT (DUF2867 family)
MARALAAAGHDVQISSRHPHRICEYLKLNDPHYIAYLSRPVDITKPSTLRPAFQDASMVVSLVGLMHGTTQEFDRIQWTGAENVARAARDVGARLVHISAIGADRKSKIDYARTKALGEEAALSACPNATIIRPSIVFGPEDDFFNVC